MPGVSSVLRKYRVNARVKSAFLSLASGLSARSPTRVSRRVCRGRVRDCCPQMLVLSSCPATCVSCQQSPLSSRLHVRPSRQFLDQMPPPGKLPVAPGHRRVSVLLDSAAPHPCAPALAPPLQLVCLLLPDFLRWAGRGQRRSHSLRSPWPGHVVRSQRASAEWVRPGAD